MCQLWIRVCFNASKIQHQFLKRLYVSTLREILPGCGSFSFLLFSNLRCVENNKSRRAFCASAGPRRAAQLAMRAESLSTPRHGGRSSSTAAQSLTAASTRALDGYITGRSLRLFMLQISFYTGSVERDGLAKHTDKYQNMGMSEGCFTSWSKMTRKSVLLLNICSFFIIIYFIICFYNVSIAGGFTLLLPDRGLQSCPLFSCWRPWVSRWVDISWYFAL